MNSFHHFLVITKLTLHKIILKKNKSLFYFFYDLFIFFLIGSKFIEDLLI